MKALKYLLYLIVGLAALVVALGLFGKKSYHIERSATINAPHSVVKEMVSQWANFSKWSPWQQLDPAMTTSIDGTDGTVGAKYNWAGNKAVGTGSMTYTAISDEKVAFDVNMNDWNITSPSAITMQKDGANTKATWAFDMHIPFPWNAFAMFTDIDKGVGKDYQAGIERLKSACEAEAAKYTAAEKAVQVVQAPAQTWVGFRKKLSFTEMEAFTGECMGKLYAGIPAASIVGNPASLYFVWDPATMSCDMAVVVPVKGKMAKLTTGEAVETFTTGGNAAKLLHIGSYEDLKYPHTAMDTWFASAGKTPLEPVLEVYLNSPETEKDAAKLQTEIYYFFTAGK